MKKSFPVHGMIGIASLLLSETFLFEKVDPFYSWFYCFAWWPYILTVDAVIYRLKGNSLILNRTKEFFLMIPTSASAAVKTTAKTSGATIWPLNQCRCASAAA